MKCTFEVFDWNHMAELCHLGVGWVGLLPPLCVLWSFYVSRMDCFSDYKTDASFWNSEIWWQRPYLIYLTSAVDKMKYLLAKDVIHFLHWKQKFFLFYCWSGQCSFHNTVLPRKGRQAKEQRQNGAQFPDTRMFQLFYFLFFIYIAWTPESSYHWHHILILNFFHFFFFFCQRCIFSLYNLKILCLSHVWSPKIKIGLYRNEC